MFYLGVLGFLSGVLMGSFLEVPLYFSISLAIVSLAALTCGLRDKRFAYVSLVLICFLLGVVRFGMYERGVPTVTGAESVSGKVLVVNEPDVRENSTRLTVELEDGLRAIIITELLPEYQYGDVLRISGDIEPPENFETETGREFDYVNYLRKDNIFYLIPFPEIEVIGQGQGNLLKELLFSTKRVFIEKLQAVIPEPESSLAGGLLLGARRSLGSELEDTFRATGIIHIVVLSGYNVTIVTESIMATLGFLPRVVGGSIGIFGIVLFALITGGGATIVRASIMACLVVVARLTYREYSIMRALFLAGAAMVFHNPLILAFDISFQLSFMATLGLIMLSPRLEKYFLWVPKRLGLREVFTATIATQIFVLPLLLYSVGELSIVALPVNLLVLATVPATMLASFITGLVGLASTTLAIIPGSIAHLLLSYELLVVEMFAKLPFASVVLPQFPFAVVIGLYGVYAFFVLEAKYKNPVSRSEAGLE